MTTNLLDWRHSDYIGRDFEFIAAATVARAIAPDLAAAGYATADGPDVWRSDANGNQMEEPRLDVYRVADGRPERVTRADLRADAVSRARDLVEALKADNHGERGWLRAANAADLLHGRRYGARKYASDLVEHILDALPELGDDALAILAEERAAVARERARRRHAARQTATLSRRLSRAEARARADADTRAILAKLPQLFADREEVDLADLWAWFRDQCDRSATVAEKFPGAREMGRNRFYALVSELYDVRELRSASSRSRLVRLVNTVKERIIIAIESLRARVDDLLGRQRAALADGRRVEALLLQRERLGVQADLYAAEAEEAGK